MTTAKVCRVRTCNLDSGELQEEAVWIEPYREFWSTRFDALDEVVAELVRKEKSHARKK